MPSAPFSISRLVKRFSRRWLWACCACSLAAGTGGLESRPSQARAQVHGPSHRLEGLGILLSRAAIHVRSSEAKGLAGALTVIQQQSYGPALLGITAAGLIAFGLYGIAEAAYRRITPPRRLA
jgi:hypothetical protein